MTLRELKQPLDELQLPTYDFKPPETFRVQWASLEIQNEYESKIAKLSQDFCRSELLTVFNRERAGCITTMSKEDLLYDSPALQEIRGNGCFIYPLNYIPIVDSYSNEVQPLQPGQDYQVRVLITNRAEYPNMNHLGHILGYPHCCVKFFDKYWSKLGYRDLVPCMEGIQFLELGKNTDISDYFELCNILIKGMGVRAVPHLPCSLKCHATNTFAHMFIKYLPNESYKLLIDLLRMETNYSTYHGYAEVKNKLFKNVFNSIPLGYKLEFTLKQLIPLKLNSNNGFTDKDSETRAHHEILNFISTILSMSENRILDLGCGDGSLLRKIGDLFPDTVLEGVEINKTVSEKAESNQILVFNQDLNEFIFNGKYSLIMIANQRIKEMDEAEHIKFFHNVKSSTKYLLIYDYTADIIIYPINFSRIKNFNGINTSMSLYVPYKVN
jgi:hypothetical protein